MWMIVSNSTNASCQNESRDLPIFGTLEWITAASLRTLLSSSNRSSITPFISLMQAELEDSHALQYK
jgi:hypothetical protein